MKKPGQGFLLEEDLIDREEKSELQRINEASNDFRISYNNSSTSREEFEINHDGSVDISIKGKRLKNVIEDHYATEMGEEEDDRVARKMYNKSRAMYETQSMLRRQKDIKHKEYHKIFLKWRLYDLMTSIFANLGLLIGIVLYEIDVHKQLIAINVDDENHLPYEGKAMETPRFNKPYNIVGKWLILGTSVIAVVFLVKRYQLKTRWVNNYFNDLLQNYRVDKTNIDYYWSQAILGFQEHEAQNKKIIVKKKKILNP